DAGGRVTAVATASEALETLATVDADVVLCDIGLPGEDGYGFIRRLRALEHHEGAAIPAIALTAYAQESDRRRALDPGFQAHLAKPVQPTRLLRLLASGVPPRVNAMAAVEGGNEMVARRVGVQ